MAFLIPISIACIGILYELICLRQSVEKAAEKGEPK
jgi:hypothetical protein